MGLKEGVNAAWHGALSPIFAEFAGDVQVECLDRASSEVDPVYGEKSAPKQYLPPVTLKGRWKLERERMTLPGGEEIEIAGKVTVRTEDLRAAGIALDFGARITVAGLTYSVARIGIAAQVGEQHLLTRIWLKEP
jgi:hypothetical protein